MNFAQEEVELAMRGHLKADTMQPCPECGASSLPLAYTGTKMSHVCPKCRTQGDEPKRFIVNYLIAHQ